MNLNTFIIYRIFYKSYTGVWVVTFVSNMHLHFQSFSVVRFSLYPFLFSTQRIPNEQSFVGITINPGIPVFGGTDQTI